MDRKEYQREYQRARRVRLRTDFDKAPKTIKPEPATALSTDEPVVIDGAYGTPPITNPKGRKNITPKTNTDGLAPGPITGVGPTIDGKGQLRRDTAPKGNWHNPYNDGLPDWPELIQGLTQHQRDEILAKINRGTKF